MITLKRNIKVEVELPEGKFYCYFGRKKQNDTLKDARELAAIEKQRKATEDPIQKLDLLEKSLAITASSLERIEGLADDEGNEITVEQFKNNEVYADILLAIIKAYVEYSGGGSEEKKS
jgi:hypothetical protein